MIRSGTVIKAEGAHELIEELDPTKSELIETLTDEQRQRLIETYNCLVADDPDCPPVAEVHDLPPFVFESELEEWFVETAGQTLHTLAVSIMRLRDDEYVHLTEQTAFSAFHTVVRLHPTDK
jgi:hypothetical protein